MTTRTKITTESNGDVCIVYVDDCDEVCERTFFVPIMTGGGYIRERDEAGRYPQVCEQLRRCGSTLMSTRDALADTIRREYRRMRAAERRERDQYCTV